MNLRQLPSIAASALGFFTRHHAIVRQAQKTQLITCSNAQVPHVTPSFWQVPVSYTQPKKGNFLKHFLLDHLKAKENQIAIYGTSTQPINQQSIDEINVLKKVLYRCYSESDLIIQFSKVPFQKLMDKHTDLVIYTQKQFSWPIFKKQLQYLQENNITPPRPGFY